MGWDIFGSVLGTAADWFTSERDRKESRRQFDATTLTARVNEAKRLGLSPLAVLGSPTASPTIMGSGQSNLGSHLKDLVSQIQKSQQKPKKPSFKNRDPLEVRAQLAEIRRLEAEAGMAEKRLSDTAVATSPGQPITAPTPNLFKKFKNQFTGEDVYLFNEDANMEMPESVAAAMALMAKKQAKDFNLRTLGAPPEIKRRKSKNVEWHPSMKRKQRPTRWHRRRKF